MQSSEQEANSSHRNIKTTAKVTQNIEKHTSYLANAPIAEIEVKPHDHPLMSLGIFENGDVPKGFCVEFNPDTDLVTANITSQSSLGKSEYLLHIVNNSAKTLSAEIWQL